MKQFHLLFIISVSFFFFSCINDIEFNGEQQKPMLVLNSFVTPDSVVKVLLTRSKFFLDNYTKSDTIINAEVKLFVNDIFVEKLNPGTNGYYTGTYFPKENDMLKFVANSSQLGEVTATTNIVPKQAIIGIDSSSVSLGVYPQVQYSSYNGGPFIADTTGYSYSTGLDLRIRFKDAPNVKNYYRLVLKAKSYYTDGKVVENTVNSSSDDLVFGSNNTDILGEMSSYYLYNEFNDQLFDGKTYELKTRAYFQKTKSIIKPNTSKPTTIGVDTITRQELIVVLQSISESYYHYLKTIAANQSGEDFFSEPVQIYSNIQNGLGILGSYTSSSKVFDLPESLSFDSYIYGGYGN